MSFRHSKTKIAILGAAVVGAAFYGGYLFGRSTLPVVIVHPEGHEIVSNWRSNVTASTTSGHHGTSSLYRLSAYFMVNHQVSDIMESIVGTRGFQYYVYVLPEPSGLHLIVHHDNHTPNLTDKQYHQLVDRLRGWLSAETTKSGTPSPQKLDNAEQVISPNDR